MTLTKVATPYALRVRRFVVYPTQEIKTPGAAQNSHDEQVFKVVRIGPSRKQTAFGQQRESQTVVMGKSDLLMAA